MIEHKFDNCSYNKVKLLCQVSELLWFIEKHAQKDAEMALDEKCFAAIIDLKTDLEKHIVHLKTLVEKTNK